MDTTSSSDSSKISTSAIIDILDRLRRHKNRTSTKSNYYTVWKLFNGFLIKLDVKPRNWEDRILLFLTHLVNEGHKSTTIRSYYSALKVVLWDVNVKLNEDQILLGTITRACKLSNDVIAARFPIHIQLLEMILFEIERQFDQQHYLKITYQALFALAYYGLFRIGELTQSSHVVKAKDIHMATNKHKLLILLYTSKTHDEASLPQKVKISGVDTDITKYKSKHFCPFELVARYIQARGDYKSKDEQFFVFKGNIAIHAPTVHAILSRMLQAIGLNTKGYSFQSLRSGRASDLAKWGFLLEVIKRLGRWKSNAIYNYIKL